jgi:hypothetical protein
VRLEEFHDKCIVVRSDTDPEEFRAYAPQVRDSPQWVIDEYDRKVDEILGQERTGQLTGKERENELVALGSRPNLNDLEGRREGMRAALDDPDNNKVRYLAVDRDTDRVVGAAAAIHREDGVSQLENVGSYAHHAGTGLTVERASDAAERDNKLVGQAMTEKSAEWLRGLGAEVSGGYENRYVEISRERAAELADLNREVRRQLEAKGIH